MKLLALEADQDQFRSVHFRPGLTLILGDSQEGDVEGSSNGVGKTLALGLVHHCLGANADARLARAVPNWTFRLRLKLDEAEHVLERSGNGKVITWDGEKLTLKRLRERLNNEGPFSLAEAPARLTFRSLFARFARHDRDDCRDPIQTKKEQESDALLRVAFLLGLDTTLIENKITLKHRLEELKDRDKLIESNETYVSELLRMRQAPQVRLNSLSEEIAELEARLKGIRIATDYRAVEERADAITREMRDLGQRIAVLDFQMDGIRDGLRRRPDLTKEDLLGFYKGLEAVFKPEALREFSEIATFHGDLLTKRRVRLERERLRLEEDKRRLGQELKEKGKERDRLLAKLQGTTAIDEYTSMTVHLAELREEMASIKRFLDHRQRSEKERLEVKGQLLEQDARTTDYLETEPLAEIDETYRRITKRLFPSRDAGVVLEQNVGDNKLRYKLRVELQGDGSDGINAARVLAFDWLVLTHGARHRMGFLWHDGRLFAHMDPKQRAAWFAFVVDELARTGKSYVATLNSENFASLQRHLSPDVWQNLQESVVLRLSGDHVSEKLLGVQFEGS